MRSMEDLPREFALAASCAIWPPSERRIEAVRRTAAAVGDWDRFVRVVARQRIQGLAYDRRTGAGVDPPRHVLDALRAEAQAVARESLSLVAEAARLRDAFGG